MKNKKKIIIITVFLIIPLVLFLLSYIDYHSKRIDNVYLESFKGKLMATVHQGTYFNLNDITSFEWDRMYVIRPYTSRTEMHKIVGTKWTTQDVY